MKHADPIQLRERLEGLGSRRRTNDREKVKATSAMLLLATFALGAALSAAGFLLILEPSAQLSQDGIDWLALEIAEKHDIPPSAGMRLIEERIFQNWGAPLTIGH